MSKHLHSVVRGLIFGVVMAACTMLIWWASGLFPAVPMPVRIFCITVFVLSEIVRLTGEYFRTPSAPEESPDA